MSTYAQSARGRRRSGARRGRGASAVEFGRERMRFRLHREQRRLRTLNIDPFVEHADWVRDSGIRTGELNFRRPLTGLQAAAIAQGDRVRCEVDLLGDGRWRRLWQMTVSAPEHQIVSGIMALALKSEMKALQESTAAFSFKGRDARQITLAVGRRFNVKVGKVPPARHKIDKLMRKSAHPLDVITAAWKEEREATGRRFDVDISRGQIDVVELVEPKYALVVGEAITDITLRQTLSQMASAVIVTSTRTVAGKKRKMRVKVVDEARVRRFGYIVKNVNKANLKTEAAARRYGREQLARVKKPTGSVTFSHPGLPFLDRGDPIRLRVKDGNLDYIAWVQSSRHAVSAGSYTMDVQATFADPWIDARKERAKKKREQAARRRKRAGATGGVEAPKSAKAARRSGS